MSNRSSFLVSFSIRFFDGDVVDIIVGAERNNFQIGCDVVYNASSDAVNVKVIGIHECHTA